MVYLIIGFISVMVRLLILWKVKLNFEGMKRFWCIWYVLENIVLWPLEWVISLWYWLVTRRNKSKTWEIYYDLKESYMKEDEDLFL